MRTVGIGADKNPSLDVEELKKENKALKSANTKLANKNEELERQIAELTAQIVAEGERKPDDKK